MTAIIALAHAFRTNSKFNPEILYLGAFIVDLTLISTVWPS
jgi:hypothetical protein